jgi:GNAT superfamily N-acetyltransferase
MSSGSAKRGHNPSPEITIRPFEERDACKVRELFIAVNRLLSPTDLREAFEVYIEQALAEEIDRIATYYSGRNGGFWVAIQNDSVVGMFGLERGSPDAMELRRMYVDPKPRRAGIGRRMLCFAEEECRRRGVARLDLSTAEIQEAALALYRKAGYRLVREGDRGDGEQQDRRVGSTTVSFREKALRHRIGRFLELSPQLSQGDYYGLRWRMPLRQHPCAPAALEASRGQSSADLHLLILPQPQSPDDLRPRGIA